MNPLSRMLSRNQFAVLDERTEKATQALRDNARKAQPFTLKSETPWYLKDRPSEGG